MTQLYSNLVYNGRNTTYLCLVLVVLGLQRSQGSGLPHCTLLLCQHHHHAQLSKHSPFIDLGRQRRTNTWSLKQRVGSAWWKQAFPVLPSLVKMQVGRGNIWRSDQNTDYSTPNKIWITQH